MKVKKNITLSPKAILKAKKDRKAEHGDENFSQHVEELILNHKSKK